MKQMGQVMGGLQRISKSGKQDVLSFHFKTLPPGLFDSRWESGRNNKTVLSLSFSLLALTALALPPFTPTVCLPDSGTELRVLGGVGLLTSKQVVEEVKKACWGGWRLRGGGSEHSSGTDEKAQDQSCLEKQNKIGHRKLGAFPSIFPSLHPHLHVPAFDSSHGQPEQLAFLDHRWRQRTVRPQHPWNCLEAPDPGTVPSCLAPSSGKNKENTAGTHLDRTQS